MYKILMHINNKHYSCKKLLFILTIVRSYTCSCTKLSCACRSAEKQLETTKAAMQSRNNAVKTNRS